MYPALAPVLEMTSRAGSGRRWLPDFMKGKVFWAGFALTSIVFWWNMIAWFYPMVPSFPTATGRFIWDLLPKEYPPFFIFLSTPVICFSYFASLDVLFSIWFFDFVYMIEAGALNRLGIVATSPHYGAGPLYHHDLQVAGGRSVRVAGLLVDLDRPAPPARRGPERASGDRVFAPRRSRVALL